MKTVSKEASHVITQAVAKKLASERATAIVADALVADGVTPEMMRAPKDKDADRSFYDSLCKAVVAGFTASVQTLLKKETKTLSDAQKKEKREWQQQIGSKIKDFRNALQRRIDKANASEEGEGAGKTSTLEARLKRDIAKYISQLEKVESFNGNIVELVKCLKSALVYVK
jgi:hypothetical protein